MKYANPLAGLAILVVLLFSACTDPTYVGADLLDDDRASIDFTDTVTLNMTTIRADSVIVYQPAVISTNLLFGDFADPIFGRSIASAYVLPRLRRDGAGLIVKPNFAGAIVDSVVLVLPYDSSSFYGNVYQPFGMDVLEIAEDIVRTDTFYSNITFATQSMPIGQKTFVPSLDSNFVTKLVMESAGDTAIIAPHLRVRLSDDYGARLVADTSIFKNDTTFLAVFKGLYLNPSQQTTAMLNFNSQKIWAGVYVYYHQDNSAKEYLFPIYNYISNYNHERSGAPVAPFINSYDLGDSLVFVQGMEGLLTKMDIPDLRVLGGEVINHAELEVTVAQLPGDDLTLYPPSEQLVVLRRDSDGRYTLIRDIADQFFRGDLSFFGGEVEELASGDLRYRMNITLEMQDVLDGGGASSLYLAVLPRAGNPSRVVLRGPRAGVSPAKLKIAFTRL